MSLPFSAPRLADQFALIVGRLCAAVATRSAADRAAAPVLVLIWARLSRMAQRFAALAVRIEARKLPPARLRNDGPRPPRTRQRRLPESYAWLIRLVPEAACFGEQIRHLLSDPEMAALLRTAPQARRIVRPLCRMLAVQLDPTLFPPPPKRPARTPSRPRTPVDPAPPDANPPDLVRKRWRGLIMPYRPPWPA